MIRHPRIAYPLTGDSDPFTGGVSGINHGGRGGIRLARWRIVRRGSGIYICWWLLISGLSVLVGSAYNNRGGKKSPCYYCRRYPTIIITVPVPVIMSGMTSIP
jgi:hypothetical protein